MGKEVKLSLFIYDMLYIHFSKIGKFQPGCRVSINTDDYLYFSTHTIKNSTTIYLKIIKSLRIDLIECIKLLCVYPRTYLYEIYKG